ncbi:MAG: hypothetical protein IT526_03210 [Nitrosomonas sp.]|nr:hypothetical protein [Burkholderiales bacterium]MCC6161239.1 hypothetical protein [Nitrosomonas sp.]MDL1866713.1 hypothetical protein [Betaproteobacteria bacterium PRO4]
MNGFKMMLDSKFWTKLFVIAWWSVVLGTYLWLLSFVPKAPLFDHWCSVVASTLLGGAGINHITSLYKVPLKNFDYGFAWPPFFVSVGGFILACGIGLGAFNPSLYWAQVVSVIYILVAVFFMTWGADSAPPTNGNRDA